MTSESYPYNSHGYRCPRKYSHVFNISLDIDNSQREGGIHSQATHPQAAGTTQL